jgi:hypothetical protein
VLTALGADPSCGFKDVAQVAALLAERGILMHGL